MKTISTMMFVLAAVAMAEAQPPQIEQVRLAVERVHVAVDQSGTLFRARADAVPVESKVVKGAPYSAEIEIESVQALADGNRIVHRTTGRVFRDSEGRVRREEDRSSGQPMVTIFDPVADVNYTLDVERRVATKSNAVVTLSVLRKVDELRRAEVTEIFKKIQVETAKAQAAGDTAKTDAAKVDAAKVEAARGRVGGAGGRGSGGGRARGGFTAANDAGQVETLAPAMMEGVRAEGKRRTTTIAAGQIGNELPITIVSEEWTSPDLQMLVMTRQSDPRVGVSTYRLRNINRTEPFASMFQVPADYTVRESPTRRD